VRVLVLSGSGYENLGDEFILEGTLNGINTALPDAHISVASFNPETTRKWHHVDVIPSLHSAYDGKNSRTASAVGIGKAWASFLLSEYTKQIPLLHVAQEMYAGYDLIIQAGGGYFNDLRWRAFPSYPLELLGAIHSAKPIAMIGQTIGPFVHRFSAARVSCILKQIPFIYVRDEGSIQVLNDLGVHHAMRCADSALLVNPGDFKRKRPNEEHVVVFMQIVRPYIAESGRQNNLISREELLDSLAKVLSEIAATEDVDILITTSTLEEAQWQMCEELALRLANSYGNTSVRTLKSTSPQDICYALSNAKLCISMNMHPLILASALRIPCVGLSYWWKLDQFMKESQQTHQTIPLNVNGLEFQELLRKAVRRSFPKRDDKGASVHNAILQLKRQALLPFERLLSFNEPTVHLID
jgi:polysaccharide pyruvyl transferase WcaK-like protein